MSRDICPIGSVFMEPRAAKNQPNAGWLQKTEGRLNPYTRIFIWVFLFQFLLVVYLPSLRAPFIYDDLPNIVSNPDLRHPTEPSRFFSNHETSMQFDHRPLVGILTMVNFQLVGLDVVPYRIANLVLHWMIAILIGEFIIRIARHFQVIGGKTVGMIVGILWAIHPLNTVTVIFISQRMEAFMVLFYLLALLFLLQSGREGHRKSLLAVFLCCVACLASKEVGVSLIASLVLLDRVFHFDRWKEQWSQRWKFYGSLAVVWAVFITWWTSGERIAELQGAVLSDPWRYFQTQCRIIISYAGKVIWPDQLVFVASPKIVTRWLEWVPFALLIIVGFSLCIWAARHDRRWLWVPTCLFFLVLGPTSSFLAIPQEPEAEWRMYLPSACLLAIIIPGIFCLTLRLAIPPKVLAVLGLLVVTALGVTTWQRAGTYRTAVSLWSDNVVKDPASTKAWINLGYSYYREGNIQGVSQAADALWRLGAAYDDSWSRANSLRMLAWVAIEQERWPESESLLLKALEEYPTFETKTDLGQVLVAQEKWAEARAHLEEALADRPDNFPALVLYAEALLGGGDSVKGEKILQKAEKLDPGSPKIAELREKEHPQPKEKAEAEPPLPTPSD